MPTRCFLSTLAWLAGSQACLLLRNGQVQLARRNQDWQAGLDPLKHVVSPKPARGTIISLNPAVSAEPKAGWCSWLGEMLGESGGFCRRSTLRATGGVAQATPQFGQVRPALASHLSAPPSAPRRRYINLIVAATTCREGGIQI